MLLAIWLLGGNVTTGEAIEASFKELLKTVPYAKITISKICAVAGVSRKSFYGCFRDKEAIIEELFKRHVIEPIHNVNQIFLHYYDSLELELILNKNLYQAIAAEKEYYCNLVAQMHGGENVFFRVVTRCIYELNLDLIPEAVDGWQRDYIAYFYAASQATFIQKWLEEKMPVPPDELGVLYNKMTSHFWQSFK